MLTLTSWEPPSLQPDKDSPAIRLVEEGETATPGDAAEGLREAEAVMSEDSKVSPPRPLRRRGRQRSRPANRSLCRIYSGA